MELLRIVDWTLATTFYRVSGGAAELEQMLSRARSAYTVRTRMGKVGLVARVPAGVRTATEAIVEAAMRQARSSRVKSLGVV